jgi:hypothetical protein
MLTSKANATILLVVMLVASIGAYYLLRDQWLTTNQAGTPYSFFTEKTLTSASVSTMLAAPIAANDSNWAGYIIASDLQNPQANVTGVSASWIVPTVTISSQDAFSAVWIGVGGFFDSTLIQTGTEQNSVGEQSEYYVWYELLPDYSTTIDSIIVSPGDQINASIQLVDPYAHIWSIYIEDVTTGQVFQNEFIYTSSQLSAEWIVERPEKTSRRSPGTLTSLTDVGTISFTNCQATIGEQSGSISSFPIIQAIMYESVQETAGITQLAAVSSLMDGGSSFMVETSPEAIPELITFWAVSFMMGTVLFAVALRRIHHTRNNQIASLERGTIQTNE